MSSIFICLNPDVLLPIHSTAAISVNAMQNLCTLILEHLHMYRCGSSFANLYKSLYFCISLLVSCKQGVVSEWVSIGLNAVCFWLSMQKGPGGARAELVAPAPWMLPAEACAECSGTRFMNAALHWECCLAACHSLSMSQLLQLVSHTLGLSCLCLSPPVFSSACFFILFILIFLSLFLSVRLSVSLKAPVRF